MNKNLTLLTILFFGCYSFALDIDAVFENQKKSAFPDTCELRVRTTVQFPGRPSQIVESSVITAGEAKSVTTIKASLVQMKIVQNGNRMRVTDLKTGKKLSAGNMPAQNPTDITKQFGSPGDYETPVKIADGFWKITPKDPARPSLYYSAKSRRIVKMEMSVNGTPATTEFEYCGNSCRLPGTLKKAVIRTFVPQGGESVIILEVIEAKRRHQLPKKMFDVD